MHITGQIVVIGAGGHAAVLIDMLQSLDAPVVGILTADPAITELLGVPVLGDDSLLPELKQRGITHAVVALGDNHTRRRLFDRVIAAGLEPFNVIHPSAVISRSVVVGRGVAILPNTALNALSQIGDNVIINTGATIDHHGRIASDVHIAPGCHLAGHVTVGRFSFLGVGASVIPKIRIGENVIVGAGTTVYQDIQDNGKVVGAPMRYLESNRP